MWHDGDMTETQELTFGLFPVTPFLVTGVEVVPATQGERWDGYAILRYFDDTMTPCEVSVGVCGNLDQLRDELLSQYKERMS